MTHSTPDRLQYTQEAWLKHLEFIQAIIMRFATNSFLIKGWALTVTGALFGFAASHINWRIATVSLLPAIAFWCLDGYFLRQERLYRALYDAIASQDHSIPPFSLNPSAYRGQTPLSKALTSSTLIVFYGVLTMAALALIIASIIA